MGLYLDRFSGKDGNLELSVFSCQFYYRKKLKYNLRISLNISPLHLHNKMTDKNNTVVIEPVVMPEPDELSMEDINARIKQEICYKTLEELSDAKLLPEYKNCNSVTNAIKNLENVLEKYVVQEKKQKILEEYLTQLIPAGTKGVIRGNKFNSIIKDYITNLKLDTDLYEIYFEKKCEEYLTTEIPDWYIQEKSTHKIIIGMNQLDIWGGGQQLNRGSKYIENNKHNTENSKLLCVVCNEIQFKSKKNKAYKLFETGFHNNTLCYLNNLRNIIFEYFHITPTAPTAPIMD